MNLITGGAVQDKATGKFTRIHKHWSLDNFNDGYINDGRFRVYFPEHPRAFSEGYVLRSIVAYEAYHPGETITKEYVVHHKNENKLDDIESNLEKKLFGQHTHDHCSIPSKKLICGYCGCEFERSQWRINQYTKSGHTRSFCSQDCFRNRCKVVIYV
jgi:hypothetical protein